MEGRAPNPRLSDRTGSWNEGIMEQRVLVAEDEPELADFLVRGLREEGFAVASVPDGPSTREALRASDWDVVVLDWWLPGEDGLSVLRTYRAGGGAAPVLFLTARGSVADRVRGLDSGADDYLCKPFAFAELVARIRSLLRRPDRSAGRVLAHGDVFVDLGAQRATRAGCPLELTAKEFALLALLVRNADRVVSRAKIFEHVWDEHSEVESNTLEVHVMELRRKLEFYGPRVIRTLRGQGYLMEALGPVPT